MYISLSLSLYIYIYIYIYTYLSRLGNTPAPKPGAWNRGPRPAGAPRAWPAYYIIYNENHAIIIVIVIIIIIIIILIMRMIL